MALLKGRIPQGLTTEVWYDLEIVAILPCLEGPQDAYQVTVWRNREMVFTQTYSVRTFTGGHYVMWQVVSLLRNVSDIMDRRTEVPRVPLPPEAWCRSAQERILSAHEYATWMEIRLSDATRRHDRGCLLTVYLAVEPIDGLDRFVSCRVYSTPEDVAAFGAGLEAEMVQARRLRDTLNLRSAYE